MFAPLKLLVRSGKILASLVAAVFLTALIALPQTTEAAGNCSFACQLQVSADNSCTTDPTDSASCPNFCRRSCAALGMVVTPGAPASTCTNRTGGGFLRCTPCTCTPQASFSCQRDPSLGEGGTNLGIGGVCATQCNNTCTTARFADRIRGAQIARVECASQPSINCVEPNAPTGQLAVCRTCISRCQTQAQTAGNTATASDCYASCSRASDQNAACIGIPREQAISEASASGAVSGPGGRRSNIQSNTAATNEAALLPAGACVQRAVAADASIADRVLQIEIAFESASTTWTCQRMCSEQQQGQCVTGGCPGDASIRCCPPATGIPPAQQCGARGATTDGGSQVADGGAGPSGTTDTGSGSTGSGSGSGAAAGSDSTPRSSVVGGTRVAADSGGLTRLILPACIEDGGCQFSDLIQVGLNLVRFLFGLAGVLLLVVFVYAGIEYLIAGDASSVKSAEERIKKALIGLFFMFFGYTLVNFLVGLFVNA